MSKVKCIYGQSTESPCPRPATLERSSRLPDGVRICEVHAALEPFNDEVLDLTLALEKLDELEEYATEWNNRPLLALLERAKVEFEERKTFFNERLEGVERAIR